MSLKTKEFLAEYSIQSNDLLTDNKQFCDKSQQILSEITFIFHHQKHNLKSDLNHILLSLKR